MREEVMAIVNDIKKYNKTTLAFFADEDKLVKEVIDEIKDEYNTELEYDDGEILLTVERKKG
jgi:hypothetical protein